MHWSIGHSRFGQVEDLLETDWNEFVGFVHDASHLPRSPEHKHDHWWVSPMMLRDGTEHRTIEDVTSMANWIGLDLDLLNCSLETIRFRLFGTAFVAYTTANSHEDAQRWRVFILLSRPYSVTEHARLWRWFSRKFAPYVDKQCGNCNRIFYLPATWEDADNVFFTQYGRPVDVDSVLVMVPEIVYEVLSYSGDLKSAPDGTPLITKHMIEAAQTAPEGGRLYRVLCQAAMRFRSNGWTLTVEELTRAAGEANALITPGKRRNGLQQEAQRALMWAEKNCRPLTPLERIRSRILWEQHRFGG